MKSLVPLYECLLIDASRWCRASTQRDLKTIALRVKEEGVSFLTITLPNFCSDFERCLDKGFVESTDFLGFKKTGSLPSFLKGLTTLIFDRSTGRLLDVPSKHAIFFVRQVCLYAKKIQLECTSRRTQAAYKKYVECDDDVRSVMKKISKEDLRTFSRISTLLFSDCLAKTNLRVFLGLHVPKHGPGSTADKLYGNRKLDLPLWPKRLERNFFPSSGFRFASLRDYDRTSVESHQDPSDELPVSVVCVPKTLKSPRIIAMEPAHMMYAQQSILEILVKDIEDDKLIGKMIGFSDQIPNQKLAREGSLSGNLGRDLATLDLQEASDRVPLRLVSRLLNNHVALNRAVMACRSQKASVPGFGVIRLAKFASMGSALCFPMEAMVFLSIIYIGIERALNRPLTLRDVRYFSEGVRVYGDDIIVPKAYAQSVVVALETYGLKVNAAKSFWTGKFRESCGSEYFDGFDLKTVKLRAVLPDNRQNADEFVSLVSHRNQLYKAGLWSTCEYIDNFLGKLSPFPVVDEDSPALGRHSFLPRLSEERWDEKLHRWLVRASVVVSRLPVSKASGPGALMKFFLKRGEEPIYSKDHLERAGRPRSVDTRLR